MRRTYVYDPATKEMVPKEQMQRGVVQAPLIMGDMPDFISPIDRTVINGRRGFREHCKQHGVTLMSDYKNQWERQRAARERFFTQGPSGTGVREALIRAFDRGKR